ncbi:hypothetical protein PAEPH01_1881 [Pancytospora epiphaga]|nr:hypothetical protein PAEPH01_1881 [Pancytospora epiphaga]
MEKEKHEKKRSRQKKLERKDAAEDIDNSCESETLAINESRPDETKKPQEDEGQAGSIQRVLDKELISRFEGCVDSDELFMNVHNKIMTAKYPNCMKCEKKYNWAYNKIYKVMVSRERKEVSTKKLIKWWNVITRGAAEKICEMINHILCCGPLMEAEADILARCVSLLKSYYAERAELISGDSANRGYYYKYTYFPMPNTYAYRIFISKYGVSDKMDEQK